MGLVVIKYGLSALMAAVIVWDVARFRIPNMLNVAVLLIFPAWLWFMPDIDWAGSLAAFALALALGYGLFAIGMLGAGDVKLLAVLMLYTGWSKQSVALVVYMSLAGGVLSLVLLLLRRMVAGRQDAMPAVLQKGQSVPYGVAIAAAFLWLLWFGGLAG